MGFLLVLTTPRLSAQVIDTLANWDGKNIPWTVWAHSGETVENPDQSDVNPSAHAFEVTTTDNPYDLIYSDFASPFNFEEFPVYRLKILAPATGGKILLKFENNDVSSWVEIEKTPTPGQWEDLEFDFSGTTATDYVRMVIFFDFLGTTPDQSWYLDDVIRVSDGSAGLTSNLPIVIIHTGEEIPDEPKVTGTMGIIDNGYGNMNNQFDPPNDFEGSIGIEIRGQSSQMFPKKSYGVETRDAEGEDKNVSLLGMPAESDWVLYAPYSDKSMLRNFMSFFMGSKLEPYCTRMAFCEVIVNNDYKGVYILMEKIKRDKNRVDIAKLKEDEISGDDLTGGYIVSVDKVDTSFIYGYDGWTSYPNPSFPNAKNITYQYEYPKAEDIVIQQTEYIQDYIRTVEDALISSNFSDKNEGYNKYLNASSFVDQMILCEVSKEVDKYRYSTFFHKQKDSDGGKLHAGPAWDFNLGYANVDYWPPGVDYSGWMYPVVENVEWSIMFWWKRLMQDDYFEDLFYTRWHQLREDELSNQALTQAIDSIVTYIDEAQKRNYDRWPILGEYVWPNYDWEDNDYADEVAFFENWFFNRMDWIDENINGNTLNPAAELSNYYAQLDITLTDEYFNKPVLEKEFFKLNNAPAGLEIESVDYLNASLARLTLNTNAKIASEVSVTISSSVLNGFSDVTTNTITLSAEEKGALSNEVLLYGTSGLLKMKCEDPNLLGNELEIFDLSGKLVQVVPVQKVPVNSFNLYLKPGFYVCRYAFDGNIQTQKIIFTN